MGFDFLVTGLMRPGSSYLELAEHIGKCWPATKILLMSGFTDESVTCCSSVPPGLRFLQKPFGVQELREKIEELFERED